MMAKKYFEGCFSTKMGNTAYYSKELKSLKDDIEQAHNLILSEKNALLVDDVSLQEQVGLVTDLCYDIEDLVCRADPKKENQMMSLSKRLKQAISSLLKSQENKSSAMMHYKSLSHLWEGCIPKLVGRDGDIRDIIQELTSQNESLGVSIVGLNGVGKSALAKGILNHKEVGDTYRKTLWASVSDHFNLEEIGKQLLQYYESSSGAGSSYTSFFQLLRGGPWLIVLDNLLDVTPTQWSDFQSLCHPCSKSKFLITSVNNDISVVTRTTRYYLRPLSPTDCHVMIRSKIKTETNDGQSLLADIDMLAKKCSGLPMVANFMGSRLHDEGSWKTMLDGDLWDDSEFQREILPTLAFTYSKLESIHLRKCFAYFSLFPHGHLFNMEDLIHLWIGEEFIQCQEESTLEQVGQEYFNTLVKWSILQHSSGGQTGSYEIHEFIHKLAKRVASYTCFLLDEKEGKPLKEPRHLSLSCRNADLNDIIQFTGLRTFHPFPFDRIKLSSYPGSFFVNLMYIRVLSFKSTSVNKIPATIKRLKLLRYLDISYTKICRLPEAVSTLSNLQILKLRNTPDPFQLPKKFSKLSVLRYIDWVVNDFRRLIPLPSNIGNLTCLQRLPLFKVGEKKGFRIKELQYLDNLQGSICITNLEKIKNKEEAAEAKLFKKKSLEEIEFEWTSSDLNNADISKDVLTALKPHESLKKLRIRNYGGKMGPQWLGELHHLEHLSLNGWKYCRFLPSLERLAALKTLRIGDFPDLDMLISLEHLTSLVYLEISSCEGLQTLPKLPSSLRSLNIDGCKNLAENCHPSAVAYRSMVDHIPLVLIDGNPIPTSVDPIRQKPQDIFELMVNEMVLSSEAAETCSQLKTQFPLHLEMMLHCLLFPKDYIFGKEKLVRLWSAAGFLMNEPTDDNGHRFFDFLLKIRFIIDDDHVGGTEVTKMYKFNSMEFGSFVLKLWEAKHFNEKIENATVVANKFAGYLDVCVTSGEIDREAFEVLSEFSNLRSLLFLRDSVLTAVPYNIFPALKFLRTLDLSCTGVKELPSSIRYAKQLRYLDLSWTLIETLPNSIVDLSELQTLRLEGCTLLFSLPDKMNQLLKLKHLDFDILGQLSSMPEGLGALVELQTLWAFIVGSVDGCKITELKNMKHLSGKLCISGLENVTTLEDAKGAALNDKPHLSQLEFRWSNVFKRIERLDYIDVLKGLEPNTSLKDLQIIGFPGSEFPKWVGDPLYANLDSVVLYNCEKCEQLPSLGGLPNLKKLSLLEINRVEKIEDRVPFPELRTLTVDGMRSLKEWSGLNGDNFPSVDNLTIKGCPEWSSVVDTLLPCLKSLKQLEIVDCPKLESLPRSLLSSSLQTLIIEDCPFGDRFKEGGEDRDSLRNEVEVWIFRNAQTSDEDIGEEDGASISGDSGGVTDMDYGNDSRTTCEDKECFDNSDNQGV